MIDDESYLVLNASSSVTPLNLNGWLRVQLLGRPWDEDDEIIVFVFVPASCISRLGRKQFDKIIKKASAKHAWIDEITVVTTGQAITDEEAKLRVSEIFSERGETSLDGLESTFLGFDSDSAADHFLLDHEREPVCILRQTTAKDIANVDIENSGLKLGEWCVMALAKIEDEVDIDVEFGEKLLISPSMPTMEEAMEYAKSNHHAVRFVSMPSML